MIKFEKITDSNLNEFSLDEYVRRQEVEWVWQRHCGEYKLVEQHFVDDWSPEKKRAVAKEMLGDEYISYGAFDGERVVGFLMLNKTMNGEKMILDSIQVSQEYRKNGLGRKLFQKAIEEGRKAGARKLYISACSSKETIAFYYAMGCALTEDIIPELAEDEPFDLQLECLL